MAYVETVPPGGYWSGLIRRGRTLRVTDVDGAGGASLLAYNARQPSERFNAPDTTKVQNTIFLTAGRLLLSDMGRVLFTIGGDGAIETLSGCSTGATVTARYGDQGSYLKLRNDRYANARDNLLAAVGRHGLDKRDLVPTANLFARVEVDADGGLRHVDVRRKAATVELTAELDVLVALTATPHVLDASPLYAPGRLTVEILDEPRERGPRGPEAERAYENTDTYWSQQ